MLLTGVGRLVLADVVLAMSSSLWGVMLGVVLRGCHMGLTQGLLATMVTDTAPEALRGTAFGVFNFAAGIAMLLASVLAGVIWDRFGPSGTFVVGASLAVVAFVGFAVMGPATRSSG